MTQRLEIQLDMYLSPLPWGGDECVQRFRDRIESRLGVQKVHLREAEDGQPPLLCVHFDPEDVTVGELRQFALQAGMELEQRYGHMLLQTVPMSARSARKVTRQIRRIKGVLDSGVAVDGTIRVEFDRNQIDASILRNAIRSLRIVIRDCQTFGNDDASVDHSADAGEDESESEPAHAHEHRHGGMFGERTELVFASVSGVLLATGWLIGLSETDESWIPLLCYAAAYFAAGYHIVREAIEKILLRQFEIDFLMIVAAAGAAILGQWAEGALLLFLFAIGHALESYAMGRARRAIESLADLAPETATVRRDGRLQNVKVKDLAVGEIVVVKTNERIAADGFVIKGSSSVNQSPITGESLPADKRPVERPESAARAPEKLPAENRVFAGTINQSGSLEIQVTRNASDSTLARVVTMVSEAETHRSPTQQFTDKFERFFVPTIIAVAVVLMFAFLVVDEPFSASFYRAMAVLVAASPCALAIATPSAVLSGVARAARDGVLIKGGGPLEDLGRIQAIAFDKTGTLTEGRPRVTDIVPFGDTTEVQLLHNAIAVEQLSDHPLATAVVRDGTQRLGDTTLPPAADLKSFTGRGIRATVENETVYIGKDDLFDDVEGPRLPDEIRAATDELEANGRTTMIIRRGVDYLGVIGLMDTPREAARQMIADLRKIGIERMVMISGDNQQVADAVAREVGIDDALGDLMPDDKVASIRKLRAERDVAMIGDGVNDAPAMANATVGIAMGAAGSDVALETADVALMADDLTKLPFVIGLSRQTSRIIRQNLWYSLGMVAVLVPATILGLKIGYAVLLHEGSTVVVVANALRLLGYRFEPRS